MLNVGLIIGLLMSLSVQSEVFVNVWKWIGLVFGSLFVIWQTVVLVRFAYEWSKSWYKALKEAEKAERHCSARMWRGGLWIIGLFLVFGSTAANVMMVYFFTESPSGVRNDNCNTSYWFIVSTSIGSFLVLVISLFPCQTFGYETRTATTGILQSGVIIGQITYSTFSTVNSAMPVQVNDTCIERCFKVPDFLVSNTPNISDVQNLVQEINTPCNLGLSEELTRLQTAVNACAIALSLFLTIYSAFNSSLITAKKKVIDTTDSPMFCCCLGLKIELPDREHMGKSKLE